MTSQRTARKFRIGDRIAERELVAMDGTAVRVPDQDQLVHLQFRRFAGCPVCNLHLRSVAQRHDELVATGIREVVVFHSPETELRPHVAGLPFAVIADPTKRLYTEFGVEAAPRALLDPRGWLPILRSIVTALPAVIGKRQALPAAHPNGGRLGLPADFLIAGDGRVLAAKYGAHIYDQWSVDELLSLARTPRPAP